MKRRSLTPAELAAARAKLAKQTPTEPSRPSRRQRPSGWLAAELRAAGWRRSDLDLGECGAETHESVCHRSAHWERSSPSRGPLCAQHALIAERELRRA